MQDAGRNNFRALGINRNGAMDWAAARLINLLLGNDERGGVLEMHFPAPRLRFETAATIALGGGDFGAEIDGETIENWRLIEVKMNSVLHFPKRKSGARIYLGVGGGFEIETWLGSESTNLTAKIGGFGGRALKKGDSLAFKSKVQSLKPKVRRKISPSIVPNYQTAPQIRVTAGAEFENLTADSRAKFAAQKFQIKSESNRMGFRLRGEKLESETKIELISSAVDFGTIQLLPDGQLIILMADAGTTGGYPRIAHVCSADLPILAQLNAGDDLQFEFVELVAAERLILEFEMKLSFLRTAIKFL